MEPEWRRNTQFEWYRGYSIKKIDITRLKGLIVFWGEFFFIGGFEKWKREATVINLETLHLESKA